MKKNASNDEVIVNMCIIYRHINEKQCNVTLQNVNYHTCKLVFKAECQTVLKGNISLI